jgi:hypothetical protein
MVYVSEQQCVHCDGKNCSSRVSLPVALRPLLSGTQTVDQLKGWLFATVGGKRLHYCPNCVPDYLSVLNLDVQDLNSLDG